VSLSAFGYFLRSCVPLVGQTKSRPQHDSPSAVRQEKRGLAENSLTPCRVSPDPVPHTNKPTLPFNSQHDRSSQLCVRPLLCTLLITSICCRTEKIKAPGDFKGTLRCFTTSLTGPADPDSQRDVSTGCLLDWLTVAYCGAVCLNS